jgi:alpha-tubulin suppressor-like RCC1 family protein
MRRRTLSLLALALVALGCKVRIRNASNEGGSSCSDSEECPLPQSPCRLAMCQDGVCVHVPAPGGSLASELQAQGDCKQLACDGNGNVTTWGLLSDVPPEDGNPCTESVCDKDGPRQQPKKAGDRCGDGVCSGTGICGVCIPGALKCESNGLSRCGEQGQWAAALACPGDKPVCSAPSQGLAQCVGVVKLGVGAAHACTTFDDGTIRCWGADHAGQLGAQGIAQARHPGWAKSYDDLDLGHWHACGVRGDGSVWCWGANDFGQLGTGDFISQRGESQVPGLAGVTQVAVGENHTCALSTGDVKCWGRNDMGQLGSGTAPPAPLEPARPAQRGALRAKPAVIAGVTDAVKLRVDGEASCIGRKNGEVLCFGFEAYPLPASIEAPTKRPPGRPGAPDGGADTDKAFKARTAATSRGPIAVAGLSGVAQVACGGDTSCARKQDGTVWCWGAGAKGQLGIGDTSNKFAPVQVEGLSGATTIALGDSFSCALLDSGTVSCWGSNERGQLGRGPSETQGKAASVAGLDGVVQLGVGDAFACAITKSGRTSCWGDGASGQLGVGGTQGSPQPTTVMW